MSYKTLLYEKKGKIAYITLNRPERFNAFDSVMRAELPRLWAEFENDDGAWIAVLTGAGDKAFCTGMDVREAATAGPAKPGSGDDQRVRLTPYDCHVSKPVIVAVNGACAGGGLIFVADADIVLCSDSAYFTDARVSVGIVSIQGTVTLTRRIPLESVLRLALMGKSERMSPQRAYQIGLVSQVVPQKDLMTSANEVAEKIVANSPICVVRSKKAIWQGLDSGMTKALENAWAILQSHRGHPDNVEGPKAFNEKRAPNWSYRKTNV